MAMVSPRHKAALLGLLVFSAAAGALVGYATSSEPAASTSDTGDAGHETMSPDEMCQHMPEHCEGGNASGS